MISLHPVRTKVYRFGGLRGVGKTTLLWQTADYIYGKNNKQIYFFNVNILKNLGVDLHTALEEFQRHVLKNDLIN